MAATASLRLALKTPLQFLRPPIFGAGTTADRALQALGFSGAETLAQKPISGEFSVADMNIQATRASAAVLFGDSRHGFLFSRSGFGGMNRVEARGPVIEDEDDEDESEYDEDMDEEFDFDDDDDDEDFEDDDDDEDEDSDFGSKN